MEKDKKKYHKNAAQGGHDTKLSKALSFLLRHGAV